jgi:phage-related protein
MSAIRRTARPPNSELTQPAMATPRSASHPYADNRLDGPWQIHHDERRNRAARVWAPDSLEQPREFPEHVRWVFGRALYKAQTGWRHEAATAMRGRLAGIVEVASDHAGDTYRAYYTLKCPGRVHVLYCHKKKSKRGAALPSVRPIFLRGDLGTPWQTA